MAITFLDLDGECVVVGLYIRVIEEAYTRKLREWAQGLLTFDSGATNGIGSALAKVGVRNGSAKRRCAETEVRGVELIYSESCRCKTDVGGSAARVTGSNNSTEADFTLNVEGELLHTTAGSGR